MKIKEGKADLALARRIRAAGAAIYIEEDDSEAPTLPATALRIRQTGGVIEGRAFDFHGAAAYILRVAITSNLPQFSISAFSLELGYEDEVRWLEDPLEYEMDPPMYRFGDKRSLQFERDHVLNHLADVRRTYPKGHSLEGVLLGIGTHAIPDDVRHGSKIPGFLVVWDQFGRGYRSSVSLWADRSGKNSQQALPPGIPRRGRLQDRRDPDSGPCVGESEVNVQPKK
jgi:hypothetical protein